MSVEDPLRDAIIRLVGEFRPQRVFLFGSQARGTADDHSDFDILVICEFTGSRRSHPSDIHLFPDQFRVALRYVESRCFIHSYTSSDLTSRSAHLSGVKLAKTFIRHTGNGRL